MTDMYSFVSSEVINLLVINEILIKHNNLSVLH